MRTTIVLADDHRIVRDALRRVIEMRDDLEVVGEASNGEEAVDQVVEKQPDIALVDVEMPTFSGIEAARCISQKHLKTRVLMLSMHESGSAVEAALRAGAAGYVVKSSGTEELFHAIDTLRGGGAYLSPQVTSHVVGAFAAPAEAPSSRVGLLTPRERAVLHQIADGLSSKEIATALGVSLKTVESHRSNLMQKLGIHKVSGLVRLAIREGLVPA